MTSDAPKTHASSRPASASSASSCRGLVLSAGRRLDRRAQPGQPRQPQPAAANGNGPLPFPQLRLHRVARAATAAPSYKGIDLGLEKRFSEGYGFGLAYTLVGLEGQHLRAPRHRRARPASRRTRATSTPGAGRATTTSATAWPCNFVVELPFGDGQAVGESGVGKRDPRRLDAVRASTPRAPAGRSRSPRAATTSGQYHDRPAQPGRRRRGPEDGRPVVRRRPPSRPCRRAPSATQQRNDLRGPSWQSLDLTPRTKRFGVEPRVERRPCAGTSSTSSTPSNLGLPDRNISDAQRRHHHAAGRRRARHAVLAARSRSSSHAGGRCAAPPRPPRARRSDPLARAVSVLAPAGMSIERPTPGSDVGNAPVSWGVYEADRPNPPFADVLDDIAARRLRRHRARALRLPAHHAATRWTASCARAGLALGSSFVPLPLEDASRREESVRAALAVARLLASQRRRAS